MDDEGPTVVSLDYANFDECRVAGRADKHIEAVTVDVFPNLDWASVGVQQVLVGNTVLRR
ncbi:hypothetical protein [Pilimelia columellifera]|uniref:Uncharacterized protein n=1 Tax=Pilimelia columellifera subsp. columellifera TaxID=706583 RepID=A0ABN3NKN0_9ACTN